MQTRREFVGFVAAAALGCSVEHRKPRLFEATFDVASLDRDGATIITPMAGLDGAPILIVRESDRRFHALSMQCTHEGCPVNPPVRGVITCPCHGSQYDLNGHVRMGPARLPLARYETRYDQRARTVVVWVDA